MLGTLRRSKTALAAQLVESIIADQSFFPAVVRRDVRALQADARRDNVDLIVFTNELALRNGYLFLRGNAPPEVRTWNEPRAVSDPVLDTAPLSRPEFLRAALLKTGDLEPPGSEAILIANSHGSEDMALMPRVNANMSIASPADVLAELSAVDSATPVWAQLKGTTKVAFWQAVAAAGARTGMHFALVFREACASGIAGWREYADIPANVGTIADSGRLNLDPSTIAVGRDLDVSAERPDWSAEVAGLLRDNGVQVESKGNAWPGLLWVTLGSIPVGIYFVPLVTWAIWFGYAHLRGRRRWVIRAGR